jgi:hypothetical protein
MGFITIDSGRGKMMSKEITFNCPSCNHEMSMELQVVGIELPEHVYDHIMTCTEHFDRTVDYIFSEFAKDGVAISVSGIRQMLKYLDEFTAITVEEFFEGVNQNESFQSKDSDDD